MPISTLYIADTQNHRVQKLAPDGSFLLSWGGSGSGKGEFLGPSDIALDREGRVLVVDTQNHRVQVFAARWPVSLGNRQSWARRC